MIIFILTLLISTLVRGVPIQPGDVSYVVKNKHGSPSTSHIFPNSATADRYFDVVPGAATLNSLVKRETIDEYNAAHPRNRIPAYLICMDTLNLQSRRYTQDDVFRSFQEGVDVVQNRPNLQQFPGWAGMRFPGPLNLVRSGLPVADLGTHNGVVLYYPLRPNYAAAGGGNPGFDFVIFDGAENFMGVITRVPNAGWIWCFPVLLDNRQNKGAREDGVPGVDPQAVMPDLRMGWVRPYDPSDNRAY